ncbi:FtsX-like permease family protein [Megalodesulfovibrio paquesii]
MTRHSATFLLCLSLLLTLTLGSWLPAMAQPADVDPKLAERVAQRIRDFAKSGDRSLGSKGLQDAAGYIDAYFHGLFASWAKPDGAASDSEAEDDAPGLRIGRMRFNLPIPDVAPGKQCWLARTDTGKGLAVHPLQMNALAPGTIPAPGAVGPAIYVGKGQLADFNGLQVRGSIVFMDLDSAKHWTNAATLGAQAVIYVDDPAATGAPRWLFEDKLELTPVDFPRFWMPRAEMEAWLGAPLPPRPAPLAAGLEVQLVAPTQWRQVQTDNIYAFLPGSDPALANELLVFEAFYDSTAYVPGKSPGADEASSLVALLELAAKFAQEPPQRSVLLLASSGHAQAQAGLRELYGALEMPGRELRQQRRDLTQLINKTEAARDALYALSAPAGAEPFPPGDPREALALEAIQSVVKTEVDQLSTRLMRLRLEAGDESPEPTNYLDQDSRSEEIRRLADERMGYRRLLYLQRLDQASVQDLRRLKAMLPLAQTETALRERDLKARQKAMRASEAIKKLLQDKTLKAHISLHLSSKGDGLGAFDRGFLYDIREDVNRSRYYSDIDDLLRTLDQQITQEGTPSLLRDTLRPSRLRTWESWLPDQPDLGGEIPALAGRIGLTLATVHDARHCWGTPYDLPERVDVAFLARQIDYVTRLAGKLAQAPMDWDIGDPPNGFAFLSGRANLLRQGEVFPDRPAQGSIVCSFQGMSRFYASVDSLGHFSIPGLADSKRTQHKAVLEVFHFDPDSGRVLWTVDKAATGLNNYRVKIARRAMETTLTLFTCSQIDFFDTLEPRSFRFMTIPSLFDGRTETLPMRYWYSRLDTRSSTANAVFLEPGTPLKLTLSDTVLGRKMLLLNATADHPTGLGFIAGETPRIDAAPWRAARDMWTLLEPRVQNLEERGIVNDRLRELMDAGKLALAEAGQALKDLQYDRFFESARTSWALASRVYNDVEKTTRDVLIGVLFYIALFAPFAYCFERLVFGFTHIHQRILGFLGALVGTIAIIYVVHPAFELTYSPLVVILAFFILGLSLLVAGIIFFRFEREMADLQRQARHLKSTEMSAASAFSAAFILGVSNLRRRPVRTALTCTTLIILTFTIMNFTAVKSVRQHTASRFGDETSYQGILLKHFGWQDLPQEAWDAVRETLAPLGQTTPRAWFVTQDRGRPPLVPVHRGILEADAKGAVGLSYLEPAVTGLDGRILLAGRWLREGERDTVLLPARMAELLGILPEHLEKTGEAEVKIWGMDFRVVGLFSPDRLREAVDLDGEPLTPVFYPRETVYELSDQESEALEGGPGGMQMQSRYEHVDTEQVVILPYAVLMSMSKGGGGLGGGGRLKSLAFAPGPQAPSLRELAAELADRFNMMLFYAEDGAADGAKAQPGSYLYYAGEALSYSGAPNILIPLIISACIVLNTMIGSVFERKREIAVYTSVGLAPSHVAFLFVAEALAFAVLSVVAGYILAQGAAALLAGTPLWAGMTANYSSLAGVAAMVLVILVVLVSVLYPSRMAANIAIPDVNRSWTMPRTEGEMLMLTLPFLVKVQEMGTAGGFLVDWFQAHEDVSHGQFASGEMRYEFLQGKDVPAFVSEETFREDVCFSLEMRIWLAPFDFGVRQRATLVFCPSEQYPGFREIKVRLLREAGEHGVWLNLNKGFINSLRKQLLVWRSLEDDARRSFEQDLKQCLIERSPDGWQPQECFRA